MKKFTLSIHCCLLIFFLSLIPHHINAGVIYVSQVAAGLNNGTSWGNAFISLSDALSIARYGDEIWVAKGAYKPVNILDVNASGGSDPREATFRIPSGVKLYGGFTGTETSLSQRNWKNNLTILTGDIDDNDINWDGNYIPESIVDIQGENAYHVIYTENVDINTTVDGFIITAGRADISAPLSADDPNLDGAGWYNRLRTPSDASSPAIRNTLFLLNRAASEGGAFYSASEVADGEVLSSFSNCQFKNNQSGTSGGAVYIGSISGGNFRPDFNKCDFSDNSAFQGGGAIWMAGDKANFDSCTFTNNRVTAVSIDATTLPGSGGAIVLVASDAMFTGCMFKYNHATGNPTGPFEGGGGGAVYITVNGTQTSATGASEPKFTGCGFYNNSAYGNWGAWGAAVMQMNDGGIIRTSYVNCVFYGGQVQFNGGAVATYARIIDDPKGFSPSMEQSFTNCTFTGNNANERGGAIYNSGYKDKSKEILVSTVENCILTGNTATLEGNQIYNTGENTISYSIIEVSDSKWDKLSGKDGGNNLFTDPGFVNADKPNGTDTIPGNNDDGLKLNSSSPAINSGNSSAPGLAGITADFSGKPRIQNSAVDRGAYENSGTIIIPTQKVYKLSEWRQLMPCYKCPPSWSFDFIDRTFQEFKWDGTAQLIDDGQVAIIKGKLISLDDKKAGFNVQMKLVNPHDWTSWNADHRTFYLLNPLTWKYVLQNYSQWKYWELSAESYLEGTGNLSGVLKLKHQPSSFRTGFQLGEGANALDKENGMQGLFSYSGTLKYNGKKLNMSGIASMNVDAEYCETCSSNMLKSASLPIDEPYIEQIEEKEEFNLYPVPAKDEVYISAGYTTSKDWEIFVYDVNGQLKKQVRMNSGEEMLILPLSGLKPGVYSVRIQSEDGKIFMKKLVVQ